MMSFLPYILYCQPPSSLHRDRYRDLSVRHAHAQKFHLTHMESPSPKGVVWRRREQARQRRLSEDPTQKEERLRKRRLADKARILAKKCSAQRLEQMKAYERQKRAE